MRREAIIFPAPNRAELHSEEFDPRPGPHEVLIETEVSFISTGTELAHYTAQEPRARYPWRPGYANVGVVRERGDRVRAPELGARVLTYSPHASWVKCRTDRMIVPVPERLEPGIAAASIMAGIAAAGLVYAEVRGWPWTAIFGLGLVGNLAAQSFQIAGCRVIGIDPLARRRELARLCGVERTIGGGPEEVLEAIRELTGGAMASISVDAVGHSAVVTEALQATARFGQLILLGSPRVPVKGDLTELLSELHLQSITLRGALQSTLPHYPDDPRADRLRSHFTKQQLIFDWLLEGRLQLAPLISHRLAPERAQETYDGLRDHPETYTGVLLGLDRSPVIGLSLGGNFARIGD